MTTDNTQVGLKKWCEAFIDGDISAGQFKRAVRIWHNKQAGSALDRLAAKLQNYRARSINSSQASLLDALADDIAEEREKVRGGGRE